ncbi:hypothetical protein G6731_01000 [Polynucleobacter paneuropaeus]|uniref:Uncharacterized protein n=1 Tax=Polynucleobacter paneuropaeus TaxID=2527775 RepID=A0A9Q2ZV76_9BURK|nr:hypothetical protein [Polynucleobacter paneuropaeus]
MHRIKHKHINYSKQYLEVAMCHISQHNFNDMKIEEVIKPPTPQQQRIKSLQLQKDNVAKQLKAERDRQKIAKAQQTINSVKLG